LETLELPQNRLCETAAFRRFAARLLADLPRFHEAHNGALADYRRAEGIRSAGRPVPPLARDDEWFEAPLWMWTADDPQRRRVFVRRIGREIELTDRDRRTVRTADAELPPDCKIKFRSRALLTTMFARAELGGLFIHGIGGGKYDELTDEIIRRYFGVESPPFAVVTATRRLPVSRPPRNGDDVAADERRRLRELAYHPERFVTAIAAGVTGLIDEKRRLIAEAPVRQATKDWCQAVRRVNAAFAPHTDATRRETLARLAAAERRGQFEAVLASREYSSFLFPEKDLRDFLLAIG
jgi:hypothetical protein